MIQLGILLLSFISYNCARTINIKTNGNDTLECLNGLLPCKSLDFVFNNTHVLTDSIIQLDSHENALKHGHNLTSISNFTLTSSSKATINCANAPNAGLAFVESKNITFKNIIIQSCGYPHNINYDINATLPHFTKFAVYFHYSENIVFENTTFIENTGVAVAFVNCKMAITVKFCKFISNTGERTLTNEGPAGGGIFIRITVPGKKEKPNRYDIEYNEFRDNLAKSGYDFHIGDNGGALTINLTEQSSCNVFNIRHCDFFNNTADWGGAIYLLFTGKSQENRLRFEHCTFENNTALYEGGGIRYLMAFQQEDSGLLINYVRFSNLKFIKNKAIWGGGVSVTGNTRQIYAKDTKNRNVYFKNCLFESNAATVGFAIAFATDNYNKVALGPAPTYQVVFKNCSFLRNHMQLTEDERVIGQGAVYAEEMSIVLRGHNIFDGNNYTSVVLDYSSLTVEKNGIVIFSNNSGLEGGALALYGSSWMVLSKNSTVVLDGNSARRKGGAIYYKNGSPPRVAFVTTKIQTSRCFIQYEDGNALFNDWDVTMKFVRNTAPESTGNSIYASTLKFCRERDEGRINFKSFNWSFVSFVPVGNNQPEVVTNAIDLLVNSTQWNVQPNLPFSPEVISLDEKNQTVFSSIKIEIQDNVELDPPNSVFLIKDKISRLRLVGHPTTNYSFNVITTSGQMVGTREYHANIKECPLGFKPTQNNTKCVCMNMVNGVLVRCLEKVVYLQNGQWGYKDTATNLLNTITCPVRYCECSKANPTEAYLCEFNKDKQCAPNRTGLLCSQCEEGLSVHLGDEKCEKCTNKGLLLIIPIILVLTLMVYLIILFNIDAFSGYLNAFIYCYQMVTLLIPEGVGVDQFIAFVIGVTSLQGTGGNIGLCFFHGLDNLHKLVLNYIWPVALIGITFIFGAIPQRYMNKILCRNRASNDLELNSQEKSFGRSLSFVLVISYASFTGATLKLLKWTNINNDSVLYDAAFTGYFEGLHILYGSIAVVILVFVVILFPVVLLFTPYFISKFAFIQRNRAVINALRVCYKEDSHCQAFVAFYFICRLCLQLVSTTIQAEVARLIVLTMFSVFFLMCFAAVHPYKISTYNLWDIALLTDMCFISLLSLILRVPFTTTHAVRRRLIILLKVFVYIPLLSVLLRLISYIYRRWFSVVIVDAGDYSDSRLISRLMNRIRGSFRRSQFYNVPERVSENLHSHSRYPARLNRTFETEYNACA